MTQKFETKPSKTVFVTYRFLKGSLFLGIFFLVLYLILSRIFDSAGIFLFAGYIALRVLSYVLLSVRYSKEKYTFYPQKIIREGGGIFSEYEVELIVRNITHVKMRLPFLENKFFGTGNINIESAGTAAAEISFSALENPKGVYEHIQKIMQHNGFRLTKEKIVQEEKPSVLGVFFEVSRSIGATIVIILPLMWSMFTIMGLTLESLTWGYGITIILLVLLILRAQFLFLDLKNRQYNVYEDTITYSEGFLSKNYAFIPIENLSDSTLTQTFVDRIFGLYDISISCQGTQQEIHFKNMVNGEKLEQNIDRLINKTESLIGTAKKTIHQPAAQKKPITQSVKGPAIEYRMEMMRSLMPYIITFPLCLILFPALLFWIPMFIRQLINVNCTTFLAKPQSMESRYSFLQQKNVEFSNEKIMTVIFCESFIDKWFGTCSVQFWSIGSSENITFQNIKKTPELQKSITEKFEMTSKEKLYSMNSHFSFAQMLLSDMLGNFFALAVFCISITALMIGPWIGQIIGSSLVTLFGGFVTFGMLVYYFLVTLYNSYYYKTSKMTFYKDYIHFEVGIFFRNSYYCPYGNIKDITTIKYPFSKRGSIQFNVAGEQVVQQGKSIVLESNNFAINFVDDIDTKDELIDLILYQRPSAAQLGEMEKNMAAFIQKPVHVSRPAVANAVTGLLLWSFIIFPFILFLPLTLPLTIWGVKVKRYSIQPYRVIAKSGIFYKKQISIVFNKVDHINSSQGMFNKLFSNGNISVNTSGSSLPELVIRDIPDYKKFYAVLKEHY